MPRFLAPIAWALLALGGPASAFEVRVTLKKVDADQSLVQFTAGQQDRSARVAADAKILDRQGAPLEGGLKAEALKPGTIVTLTVERVDEKPLIRAIRLGEGPAPAAQPATARTTEFHPPDTSKLVPLTDLGTGKYQGFEGGLYPDGRNQRPDRHEAAGLALAGQVRPLNAEGRPSPEGKIALLGIGFSNTVQAFNGFMEVAKKDPTLNRRLVLVNGAVGGMSAEMVQQAESGRGAQYWSTVDERLKSAGVTRPQVQAVWIKETNPTGQGAVFPKDVQDLHAQLIRIVRLVHARFPNARLAYLSSRTYGGWAKPRPDGRGPGNSEPYSYESAFAVKWLVEQQLKGDPSLNFDPDRGPVEAPWLSWGPYLWANGDVPRVDGFRFRLDDFMETDRMHESPSGQIKIGGELLRFFKTDPTTRKWFLEP